MQPCCPPAASIDLPDTEAERDAVLAACARALAHPARIAILRLLIARDTCICGEIVDALPLAQSTVSQHLKVLKDAGLIRGTIDPPRTCYCINPPALAALRLLLEPFLAGTADDAMDRNPVRGGGG